MLAGRRGGVSPEQVVDGRRAAVHAPQDVSGAALQVPAQRQAVQVDKQAHLNHPAGVLLHTHPQEGAQVTDEPRGAWVEQRRIMWWVGVRPGFGEGCYATGVPERRVCFLTLDSLLL